MKWVKFKNLIESIKLAEKRGLNIFWKKEIQDVVFDAVVEVKDSSWNYIIVIKIIDSDEIVSAEQVELYLNDSQKVRASLAILASGAGFIDECAKFYDSSIIRLITLDVINQTPPSELTKCFDLILNLYNFRLTTPNNKIFVFPNEPEILKIFMQNAKIEDANISVTPEDIVNSISRHNYSDASGVSKSIEHIFPKETVYVNPNTSQRRFVNSLCFEYQLVTGIDIPKITSGYAISNAAIEEELLKRNSSADLSKIETGFDINIEKNKFYYNPRLKFSYYCEKIKKDTVMLVMVESYQSGQLVQGAFKLDIRHCNQFIEVTNQKEIERLTDLYNHFIVCQKNLNTRFNYFLDKLEYSESIDKLTLTPEQEKGNKADYFFDNRAVICELKTLEDDPSYKVKNKFESYKKRPDYPLVFGRVSSQQIIECFPDKDKVNEELVMVLSKSIEGGFESANRQIRETKENFNLSDSDGLLIILNDLVPDITPEVISYRINKLFKKKDLEDNLRFPHISMVLVFDGAHFLPLNPSLKGLPILEFARESTSERLKNVVDKLISDWVKFERAINLRIEGGKISDHKFIKMSDIRARKKKK